MRPATVSAKVIAKAENLEGGAWGACGAAVREWSWGSDCQKGVPVREQYTEGASGGTGSTVGIERSPEGSLQGPLLGSLEGSLEDSLEGWRPHWAHGRPTPA